MINILEKFTNKKVEVNNKKNNKDEKDKVDDENWLDESENEIVGSLAVDVYDNNDSYIIKSTVAGVKPEDIDVVVDEDVVTIRGKRKKEEAVEQENYFFQECYWGSFERIVRLPSTVKKQDVDASLVNGVLTIKLKKASKSGPTVVKVRG